MYIHNKAKSENNKLIYGHSISSKQWRMQNTPQMPENLTPEEQDIWNQEQSENYDYSIMRGEDAISSYIASIYKDCRKLIKENDLFFKSLKDVEEINIIGHSLSYVDRAYFEQIAKVVDLKTTNWTASYYRDTEKDSHLNFLKSLGVHDSKIRIYKLPIFDGYNQSLF